MFVGCHLIALNLC